MLRKPYLLHYLDIQERPKFGIFSKSLLKELHFTRRTSELYVKASMKNPSNHMKEVNFRFLPIEPPRPPPNKRESFARRQHQFAPAGLIQPKGNIFRKPSIPATPGTPPRISVDGRLPDPAIITCNEPLPLRVLVKRLNETPELLFLSTFQIMLIGYTKIRAHDLERVEQSTWVIASHANLQNPIGNSNTPVDKDIELDSSMWKTKPLPNTIPPTFETCNISRYYELDISVGLIHGTPGNMKVCILLEMSCKVLSNILLPSRN
jgi:hypothetical protein